MGKARVARRAKAREIWEKYHPDATTLPNFNRTHEVSPNTTINRRALQSEMKVRGMCQKTTQVERGTKIKEIIRRCQENREKHYKEELDLYTNKNNKERTKIFRLRAREKAKAKQEREELQKEEELRRKMEEEQRKEDEEKQKQKNEEKRKREEEKRRRRDEENARREENQRRRDEAFRRLSHRLPTGEKCADLMELGNDHTWENVRRQFLRLSGKYHPDKNGDGEMFKKMKAAYDILKKHFNK